MRNSTKVVAIAWILIIIYWLITAVSGIKENMLKPSVAELIVEIEVGALPILGIIIGSILLLNNMRAGWWILLVLTGLAVLSSLAGIIIMNIFNADYFSIVRGSVAIKQIAKLVVFALMFILLLRDPPSRWVREPRDAEGTA